MVEQNAKRLPKFGITLKTKKELKPGVNAYYGTARNDYAGFGSGIPIVHIGGIAVGPRPPGMKDKDTTDDTGIGEGSSRATRSLVLRSVKGRPFKGYGGAMMVEGVNPDASIGDQGGGAQSQAR